jgi:ACR3 family arsenite efflux pump ArsB
MRSTAVLVAAGIAFTFDAVSPAEADSWAAIAVSVTILLSLIPLIRGLVVTARQIIIESKNRPSFILETHDGTFYHAV